MPIVVNTNVASLISQRNMGKAQAGLGVAFSRLSSGLRIDSAKDDATGLAISENLRMQIRGFAIVERNSNDAISMSQVAEGALGEVADIVTRLRELAVQAANGSYTTTDRSYLQIEFQSMQAEIKRMMTAVKYNGVSVINFASTALKFQIGIANVTSDRVIMTFGAIKLTALLSATTRIGSSATNALTALGQIDAGLTKVVTVRARYGAFMNRLEATVANTQTMRLSASSANSRIRDVDVAEETAALSRQQVLSQSAAAILAQANQAPQMALSLLRGGN